MPRGVYKRNKYHLDILDRARKKSLEVRGGKQWTKFYICSYCKEKFWAKRNPNQSHHFCSRQCAGYYRIGKSLPKEWRIAVSNAVTGEKNSFYGQHHSKATKRKISEANKGKIRTPEMRKRYKELWQNKEHREKVIKAVLKGLLKRPTSLEKQMIEIIEKYNLPYKYVGDGSFVIGWKNPDFINVNGEKKLIEVANTFHHDKDYPEKRAKYFAKYGWKSYIFRTEKLDEEEVIKILDAKNRK